MQTSSKPQPLPSLLLIDDDAISREVLAMLLEMEGFPIRSAEDGSEALTLLVHRPEVILMDTQMPGLSGLELIHALRTQTTARIVAISGSDPGEAVRLAADGFLLKPIVAADLLALLVETSSAPVAFEASAEPSQTDLQANLIDPLVLARLQAMMPRSAVREIYTAVAVDLKPRLAALETAMFAQDIAEVARISHAIKGGCAMVGLTPAKDAASRLESSNLQGSWPQELAQLRFALRALEDMLGDDFPA